MHSFSLEHVNDMSAYRRRSFRVTKDLQWHTLGGRGSRRCMPEVQGARHQIGAPGQRELQ